MFRLLAVLNSRRSRGRALLSILGIALGVALGYGVDLVNRAAVGEVAAKKLIYRDRMETPSALQVTVGP